MRRSWLQIQSRHFGCTLGASSARTNGLRCVCGWSEYGYECGALSPHAVEHQAAHLLIRILPSIHLLRVAHRLLNYDSLPTPLLPLITHSCGSSSLSSPSTRSASRCSRTLTCPYPDTKS